MSFGFSVGDFLAVASLINDVVSALRNESASSYQELALELHGLQRALHEIEHLQCPPSQQAALNSVKVAALMCQYPLDEFSGKIKKYEALVSRHGTRIGVTERLKLWKIKLQWGFSMEEEVVKLRAYICAHVGSLNMRLITLGLSSSSLAVQKCDEDSSNLQSKVQNTQIEVTRMGQAMNTYGTVVLSNNTLLKKMSNMISSGITFQLNSLVDMANKIWNSNLQIMAVVAKLQSSSPQPNTSYTWFQEPVKLEDALGRVIPIPSEYNWSKVNAIIVDQFSEGPGSEKVKAGEYILFNSFDTTQSLTEGTQALIPGMSITMAMLIGRYGEGSQVVCPRIGCNSKNIERHVAGGKTCTMCKSWLIDSKKKLPLPLRSETLDLSTAMKGKKSMLRSFHKIQTITDASRSSPDILRSRRNEGRNYKNISIHFTELPQSPSVSNVRTKQPRKRQKIKGRKSTHSAQERLKNNPIPEDQEIKQLNPLAAGCQRQVSYIPMRNKTGLTMERIERSLSVISEPSSIDSSLDSTIGLYSAPSECFGTPSSTPEVRACLRCRLLRQTCDGGEPCHGCRLCRWQVPCTRLIMQDLEYFMANWHDNFEESFDWGTFLENLHSETAHNGGWIDNLNPSDTLGHNSIGTFEFLDGAQTKVLWVSHGYGLAFPIMVCNDQTSPTSRYFVEWLESPTDGNGPIDVRVQTGAVKLTQGGLSMKILDEYLGRYLHTPRVGFVTFSGANFIPEMLQTIHKYCAVKNMYQIRQALTIITGYGIAKGRTVVEHTETEDLSMGQVLHPRSKYYKAIIAPPEIGASISAALTSRWQDLQRVALIHLSEFYDGVYMRSRRQNYLEIFAISSILLIIWEEMMTDYALHIQHGQVVQAFWTEVKDTSVNIILGLFATVSEDFPTFLEWETRKHGALLGNDTAMCEFMTEMRDHVTKYEAYLRSRTYRPYARYSFRSMSNVFLSKLVLRSN